MRIHALRRTLPASSINIRTNPAPRAPAFAPELEALLELDDEDVLELEVEELEVEALDVEADEDALLEELDDEALEDALPLTSASK